VLTSANSFLALMFPAGEEPVVHYESIAPQGISLQWFHDNEGGALDSFHGFFAGASETSSPWFFVTFASRQK